MDKLTANPYISKIRYLGGVSAFDIMSIEKGYGSKIGELLKQKFLEKGLLLRPLGSTFYLMPPYCISEDSLRNAYRIINQVVKKINKL